ncbi:basic secretory protein-like protein [Rhodopirellula sp. SWK7]|uniref:basic secretory protein-like protein n=1 Tax=Rhodopirellula sp. SWK7 TaxID=595460 RepID=UPI0002BF0C25|nr:basic secretory protein-like protein [Rhodopirellula sp. SWK7]EMI47019.1 Plant Basic Secretory Protein [Rhodopirellula sp. SWK7]
MLLRLMLLSVFAFVCLCGNADTQVRVDLNSEENANEEFRFESVPTPSASDAGNLAKIKVVAGTIDANSAGIAALNDGIVPASQDSPKANFFFSGRSPGRLLFDFGMPIDLQQINTYSWHPSSRAPQVYRVYTTNSEKTATQTLPDHAGLMEAGWQHVADVDSRKSGHEQATQVAVGIQGSDSAQLGSVRFVLMHVEPTSTDRTFAQTFFSEIDFLDGKSYSPTEQKQNEETVDVLFIENKYSISFDTTEVPELRTWVRNDLMPICEQWYPRIVAALPSEHFEPPTEFSVIFRRDMRGVAYTAGKDVFCARDWFVNNKQGEGLGAVVHELVHVVQQYRSPRGRRGAAAGERPSWLVEGIADHIRWFQYEPKNRRRQLNLRRANYDDGYFASATFLNHVIVHHDRDAISRLNNALRLGRFHSGLWKQWFGKTAEELWEDCQNAG